MNKISQAESGRNRTHDILITDYYDRRHTTRPPRLPIGYGWFDSHNTLAAGTALIYQLMVLGWVDLIILNNLPYPNINKHRMFSACLNLYSS